MRHIFRGNWRKETTAGGENSGESRKGAEGARSEMAESLRQKDGDIWQELTILFLPYLYQSFRCFCGSSFWR
jgi:hypothetical protein